MRGAKGSVCVAAVAWSIATGTSIAGASSEGGVQASPGENEIDQLMARVLDNRYTSWRQLGDFIVRHVFTVEIEAASVVPFSGFRREYEWYVRDGVAVRSPVRFDGIDVDEHERRDAEADWQRAERRRRAREDSQDLVPGFITDAFYGTEFPFEPGAYYLAGRDTRAGREVVRIEYYPTGVNDESPNPRISRGFNKSSIVTFWIDPEVQQIAVYSFDNVGMDFLPLRWLARMEGFAVSAEMTHVGGVWMPASTTLTGRVTTALGEFQATITQEFFDYREAETGARLIDPQSAR